MNQIIKELTITAEQQKRALEIVLSELKNRPDDWIWYNSGLYERYMNTTWKMRLTEAEGCRKPNWFHVKVGTMPIVIGISTLAKPNKHIHDEIRTIMAEIMKKKNDKARAALKKSESKQLEKALREPSKFGRFIRKVWAKVYYG